MKGKPLRKTEILILALLIIPLFLLNLPESHDWGGDFARYIEQAAHIVKGVPQEVTGYIYNPDYQMGPPAYPVGFPLLLAPVYHLVGNNIAALILYMSLLLALYTVCLYLYFRRFASLFSTVFLVALIIYSPWMLGFKSEVMSDIPFAILVLLFLWNHQLRKSRWRLLLSGLIAGFAILMKFSGFFILLALLLEILMAYIRRKEGKIDTALFKQILLNNSGVILILLMVVFVLNRIIFNVPSDYSSNYLNQPIGSVFLHNINVFIYDFSNYFFGQIPFLDDFTMMILGLLLLIAIMTGVIHSLRRGFTFRGMYLLSFFLLLWITPFFDRSGTRYIMPAMPFLIAYAADVFRFPFIRGKMPGLYLKVALVFTVLSLYLPGIAGLVTGKSEFVKGPQEPESQEVFQFIRTNLPDSAIIVFRKPSVLAFYTGKRSWANRPDYEVKVLHSKIWELNAGYILLSSDLPDQALEYYIKIHRVDLDIVFRNKKFVLYKRL